MASEDDVSPNYGSIFFDQQKQAYTKNTSVNTVDGWNLAPPGMYETR